VSSCLFRAALFASVLFGPVIAAAAKPTPQATAEKTAPARTNWLAVSHRTPEGAIVIGNPAAKVKVVEYLSLTCPHCAHLAAEAMGPLEKDYIGPGLVSYEVRHAVRDPLDFVASLLLRCAPPDRYLGSIEGLFATQEQWFQQVQDKTSSPQFEALPADKKIPAVARAAGFDAYFAKRGLAPKAQAACLADKKGQDALAKMTDNSWNRDAIKGTPTLMVNGERRDEVKTWDALEPLIKAGLK
jgi:protein-disulfide isomerase